MCKDITQMPNLMGRMNKYQCEAVNYVPPEEYPKRGCIENTVLYDMQNRSPADPFCGANDILVGICRLDHYSTNRRNIPLSLNRVYNILKCMPIISNREIQRMTGLSERQAGVYMRAIKIALPYLENHFSVSDDDVEIDYNFLETFD